MTSDQEHEVNHAVQEELNRQFKNFLDNHWPTLERAVSVLSGKMTVIMLGMGAMLSLLGAITVRLVFFG